jgi:hypothetical protein
MRITVKETTKGSLPAAEVIKKISGYSYVNPDHILVTLPTTFLVDPKTFESDDVADHPDSLAMAAGLVCTFKGEITLEIMRKE